MSRRSADTTIKFRKLLVIIAVWVCIGILMTCYDHFSYQSENVESTGRFYGFGKNLFFNVPARRNFLKSNPVEMKHIVDEFQRIALANPKVSFSLYNTDEEM